LWQDLRARRTHYTQLDGYTQMLMNIDRLYRQKPDDWNNIPLPIVETLNEVRDFARNQKAHNEYVDSQIHDTLEIIGQTRSYHESFNSYLLTTLNQQFLKL
jgi:hypothetical protein